MHWFTALFLTALLAHLSAGTWLAVRQIRAVQLHRRRVPEDFVGSVSDAEHARAADYTVARQRSAIWESCYDTIVLAWLTIGGGISAAGSLARQFAAAPLVRDTMQAIVSMPFPFSASAC